MTCSMPAPDKDHENHNHIDNEVDRERENQGNRGRDHRKYNNSSKRNSQSEKRCDKYICHHTSTKCNRCNETNHE